MNKVILALYKLFLKLILGLSVCGIGFSFWILVESNATAYSPLLISGGVFIISAILLYIPFRKECIKEKEEFEKKGFR